jgi:predicted acylesterase/phospholipase RssA
VADPPTSDLAPPEAGTIDAVLELQRMESALIRADLAHPGVLSGRDVERLRYLLSFARLTVFQPGAAERGARTDRSDVVVGEAVDAFRLRVAERLEGPLRLERDARDRLRHARGALEELWAPLARKRDSLLIAHAGDFSEEELDAEVGHKVLVNIAGGGGGAGFVYIGAWERLERAGVVPSYVVGASIGALIGLFRARAVSTVWADYLDFAKSLTWGKIFSPPRLSRRFGLPGLLYLGLPEAIGQYFRHPGGEPMRVSDLEIPYEAVVAGVQRRSFKLLPRRFRASGVPAGTRASSAQPRRSVAPAVALRMWQVVLFFDPRVAKGIVFGADELTAQLNAVDVGGFSAAIPGVLHYDIEDGDERTAALLSQLFEREDIAALVDGGVASNVPIETAWRRVQAGKLGTRNAFYLAFECFHPQWDPRHLWLVPITQAVQLQMARNAPYADWVVRFEPTLSPVNLVPAAEQLDAAMDWGRADMEAILPMVQRFLEPVAYERD